MSINASSYPYGLIAGGMVDGNIHVWNPSKLAEGEMDSLLASVEQHQGAVLGLHFNPHKESSHLLASGGSDAEVFVTSLEHPEEPSVFVPAPPPNNAKHTADITQVAWNSQVAHILASSAQNGSCFVWDLRQKKAWYVLYCILPPPVIVIVIVIGRMDGSSLPLLAMCAGVSCETHRGDACLIWRGTRTRACTS